MWTDNHNEYGMNLHRPRSTQPFTPYSFTLGSVVRELHRVLLLAVTAEPQHSNCILLLKALRLLMVNTTYQHLSNRYLTHITEVLEKMASHKGGAQRWGVCGGFKGLGTLS